jgi:PAS domain-containing protein
MRCLTIARDAMTEQKTSITRTLSLLAVTISLVVTVSVPIGYFIIIYQYGSGGLNAETALSARSIEKLVNSNPSTWRYEEIRLQELLQQRLKHDNPEIRAVIDLKGQTIARVAEKVSKPVMTVRETIYDAGTPAGYIELSRSVYPLLIRTSVVGLLSGGLGFLIFGIFRSIPLRALNKAHLALRENEERLKLAVASGHLGVLDWDMGKNVMTWDDGMREIFGIPGGSGEIAFETWKNAIHPEDWDRVWEEIRITSLRGGSYEDDFRIVRQDGQIRCIK